MIMKMKRKGEGVKKQYRKMVSVTGEGTKKRERKKEKTLRCRELQAVEAGFMVVGKNIDVRLLPSLSNCDRWVRIHDFHDSDLKVFVKGAAVIESVLKYGEVRNL